MNREWAGLIAKHGNEGARAKFEEICTTLYKTLYSHRTVRPVRANPGDGGIDIFIGKIGIEPITVIQCKFFPDGIGDSQKGQIRGSYKTATTNPEIQITKWILCVVNTLDFNENIWWESWKNKMHVNNPTINIELTEGDDIIALLKSLSLHNTAFEREDSIKIEEIHSSIVGTYNVNEVKEKFLKASHYIIKFKNYFGQLPETHIARKEVGDVITWLSTPLRKEEKNVLILKGDKGNGKTIIIQGVYNKLVQNDELVLCIKADKYYDEYPQGLAKKLFLDDNLSFSKIRNIVVEQDIKLTILIDQLDALSQTLSSKREYLYTYNRIICEFEDLANVRVVVSMRSFDLDYDVDLRAYSNNNYKSITVDRLSEDDVKSILSKYNVLTESPYLLELLRTPSNLDIFSKIPNKDVFAMRMSFSSKTLLDELWVQLVIGNNELKSKELVYKIVNNMYDNEQKIITQNVFRSEYSKELAYLKSNQIIVDQGNEIQFFHQTMYDYCFSRQFVDTGNKVEDFLLDNGQSIYSRAALKMIIEYYRDADTINYIKTIEGILSSTVYRVHVKELILSILGVIPNPNRKEKELIIQKVMDVHPLAEIFINSINSKGWTSFFLTTDYLRIIASNKKEIAWHLFVRNISHDPVGVVDFVANTEWIIERNTYISNLLYFNSNWQDTKTLELFDTHMEMPLDANADRGYFNILERIYPYYPDFVFEKCKQALTITLDSKIFNGGLGYHLSELIDFLETKNPTKTYEILFTVYSEMVEASKVLRDEKTESPYYTYVHEPFHRSTDKNVESYLENFITKIASEGRFIDFFQIHKTSNSIPILNLILFGILKDTYQYQEQFIELLNIIFNKQGLRSQDDDFQFSIRKIIGELFPLLSLEKQYNVIRVINGVKTHRESVWLFKPYDNSKPQVINHLGYRKYLFLLALPEGYIKNDIQLNRTFQELKRKFGKVDYNRPHDKGRSFFGGVGPPLNASAYIHMTNEDWKKSMLKINEQYPRTEWMSSRGGIEQHASAFAKAVAEEPDRFEHFLEEIAAMEGISNIYLIEGLRSLVDKKPLSEVAYTLTDNLAVSDLDDYIQGRLLSIFKIFIDNGLLSDTMFTYLEKVALIKVKAKQENEHYIGIKTHLKIEAVQAVIKSFEYKQFYVRILAIIEDVVKEVVAENNIEVKIAILHKLAYLNNIDLERSYTLFNTLTDTEDPKILEAALWSARYFNPVHHYDMKAYFIRFIQHQELHQHGNIIVFSWLNDKINDRELYDYFVSSSMEAKLCAIKIAEHYLFDRDEVLSGKSLSILYQFLDTPEREDDSRDTLSHAYAALILRKFKETSQFLSAYPFFQQYSSSKHCSDFPAYFIKYLTLCSKEYPVECLKLLNNIDFSGNSNNNGRSHSDSPVELLLSLYSIFSKDSILNRTHLEELLDIFDVLMVNSYYRASSDKAIEAILK